MLIRFFAASSAHIRGRVFICGRTWFASSDEKYLSSDVDRLFSLIFIEYSVPPDDVNQLLLCHAFLLAGFLDLKPHRTKIKFTFAFFSFFMSISFYSDDKLNLIYISFVLIFISWHTVELVCNDKIT